MAAEYPEALDKLIRSLAKLPGIGRRTAERLAVAMLEWDDDDLAALGEQVSRLKEQVHHCTECGNLADRDRCRICEDPHRDRQTLCVVEQARQIIAIEKCGRYSGLYHVLGGRLSPLEGIEASDLNIQTLGDRLASLGVREVILATSPDVEGEATAAYLAQELGQHGDVTFSRIALGVPVGSDLTFADSATMAMAMDSRRRL